MDENPYASPSPLRDEQTVYYVMDLARTSVAEIWRVSYPNLPAIGFVFLAKLLGRPMRGNIGITNGIEFGWRVSFILTCCFAAAARGSGAATLIATAITLSVTRLVLGSGGGGDTFFFIESILAISMLVLATSAFLPQPAVAASGSSSRGQREILSKLRVVATHATSAVLIAFVCLLGSIYLHPAAVLLRAVDTDDGKTISRFASLGLGLDWRDPFIGRTALHHAAARKQAEMCRLLLANGAAVNARDDFQSTPLHEAGDAIVARILLNHGADIQARDKIDSTPLHRAYWHDITKLLLSRGADIHATNKFDRIPLNTAWSGDSMRLLILAGSDVNHADEFNETPLHDASKFPSMIEIVSLLVTHGADINSRDSLANTPLHIAAGRGNTDAVRLLVKLEADVRLINNNGDTPLSLAEREGRPEIAIFLSEAAEREE